ncbi:MFS transporter [Actinomadura mexicana]|uniref:Na+/melibiose symporter n=1 Tax=Actinomadura mexicana TaxID=134959 RepID=A0A239EEX2_9ACTN|nr:MFS transporter [Actinomadura mexicana]SNS42828.1 Na+/melibiose symporter [Actinomadura mexicana]
MEISYKEGSAPPRPAPTPTVPRHWIVAYFLATLAMWTGLLAAAQILLPAQLAALDPARQVWDLGLITALGAGAAIVSSPVAGSLSDRTASRFGRRRPWVLASALVCSAALVALPLQTSVAGVGVCWVLVHGAANAMGAALCAAIPDRVPVARRGLVSGIAGLAMPVGLVVGTMLVATIPTWAGYALMGGLTLLLVLPYSMLEEHAPLRSPGLGGPPDGPALPVSGARAPRRSPKAFITDLYVSPRRHPDFAWTLSGRFFAQLSISLATLYLLYFLRDEVRVDDPAGSVAVLSLLYTAGVVVASVLAGRRSDRTGRRKPFVIVASLLMAGSLTCMALLPLWPVTLVSAAVLGAGHGVYLAIDQALVTEVLPLERDRAKDLGLINAAGSGAVAVAPLVAAGTLLLGGFSALFTAGACLAVAGGLAIQPVRSVR